jgi:hypothetical protein
MALPCNSVNSALSDAGPTIFEDRRMHTTVLYFTRQNTPGPNGFDILVDTLQSDGRWGVASVVPELTSPVRDTRTTISRDGLEMFISSGRVGGFGSEDIWISTRASTTDVWSTPVNAGGIINGSAFDGAPALSFDGRSLYFFSERTGPDANGVMPLGLRDLYVSTRTRLGDDSTDLPASGFPSNFIIDSSSVIMHGAVSLLEAGSHKGRAPSQELGVCIC